MKFRKLAFPSFRSSIITGTSLAAIVISYSGAQAAGIWDGGGELTPTTPGNYDTANNWDNNVVPGAINVDVSNGGTCLITTSHTTNDILTGTAAGSTGTWTQSAGTTTMGGGWFRMGLAANAGGTFNVNGGILNVRGQVNIGEANGTAGATATVNVAGGTFNNTPTGDLQLIVVGGRNSGANAGKGALNLSSGAINSNAGMNVGFGTGSQGTVSISGGTYAGTGTIAVGRTAGNGTLNVSGGTLGITGQLWAGEGASAVGTINLSASGTINTSSWLAIGRTGGNGTLNMSGGTYNKTLNGGDATIIGASGPGTLNQNAGLFNVSSGETWIGENNAGTWNVSGGTATLGLLSLGQSGGGNGTLNMQNAGSGPTGSLANSGGTQVVTTGTLRLGNNATGTGTVNLDGGTLAVNTVLKTAGTGTFNFHGGTLRARTNTATFMGGLNNAFVKSGGAIIDTNGNAVTITQSLLTHAVSTGGGLTKNGANTLTLSGANTFTGPITVNAGKLQAASVGAFPAAADLAINPAATGGLDFNGQYRVAAGGPAARTFNNLTAGANSEFTFNFNATGGDNIAITNAAAVTAGAKLAVSFATGTTLVPGTYTLFSAPGGLENFTFTGPASVTTGGFFYPLSYSATATADTVTIGAAQIAKLFYTGNGLDNLLSNTANFSTDAAGTIPASSTPTGITDVVFTATAATPANLSPTLDTVTAANSLQFTGTGTPAETNSVTLTGPGTLTISANANSYAAGTGIVVDAGAAAHGISANLALGASQSFANNSANTFTLSGTINGNGSALTLAGTGAKTLSGDLSNLSALTNSGVGSSRVDLQACKLEYSIVSPK